MAWRRWVPEESPTPARSVIIGVGAAGVGLVTRMGLQPVLGTELPFVTFFPAIVIAALWGGLGAGLLCLFLTCAASLLWILPKDDTVFLGWAVPAYLVSGGLLVLTGSALASTVRRHRETQRRMQHAEAGLRTMIGELAHRGRNGLTVVMAIVSQSARQASTVEELAQTINGRLAALAAAEAEVVRSGNNHAILDDLLTRTLSPFDLDRFIVSHTPEVDVAPDTAAGIALLVHELATNALKHGALSVPTGHVEISWTSDKGSTRIHWSEHNGPPVVQPSRQGFGTKLLTLALSGQKGHVERRFEPAGVKCEIDFPNVEAADPGK